MTLKPKAHRSSQAWFKHLPYFQLADTDVSQHSDATTAVLPTLWLCSGAFQSVLTTESVKTQLATTKLATMLFFIRCLCCGAAQLHYFTTTDLIWFDTLTLYVLVYYIECGSMQQWVHGSALFHSPPTNIAFNDSVKCLRLHTIHLHYFRCADSKLHSCVFLLTLTHSSYEISGVEVCVLGHTYRLSGNCGMTVQQHCKAVFLWNTSPDLFSFVTAGNSGSLCISERMEDWRIMKK